MVAVPLEPVRPVRVSTPLPLVLALRPTLASLSSSGSRNRGRAGLLALAGLLSHLDVAAVDRVVRSAQSAAAVATGRTREEEAVPGGVRPFTVVLHADAEARGRAVECATAQQLQRARSRLDGAAGAADGPRDVTSVRWIFAPGRLVAQLQVALESEDSLVGGGEAEVDLLAVMVGQPAAARRRLAVSPCGNEPGARRRCQWAAPERPAPPGRTMRRSPVGAPRGA
jgi:hypothetical protein